MNEKNLSIILPERDPCPFCENLAGRRPCAFVFRSALISSFVNPRQYGRGAVLIIPNRHAPTILDLNPDELHAIYRHAQALVRALSQAYQPAGFNVFQNNGVAAGQSIPHFHLHVVPRYQGEEPGRVFREQEFEITAIEARLAIAAAIKEHLNEEAT
jgi:histidine triad (HIT) family protein